MMEQYIEYYIERFYWFQRQEFSRLFAEIKEKILQCLRSELLSPRLNRYFQPSHELEVDCAAPLPAQVLQLKKVLRALTLIEPLLKEAETIEPQADLFDWIYLAYRKVDQHFNELYEAAELTTQFSADAMALFADALSSLRPIMTAVAELLKPAAMIEADAARPSHFILSSKKIGFVSGVAVHQMNSQDGGYDYEFLTHFTVALPGYLDQVSQYIQRYTAGSPVDQSQLIQERQEALQYDAGQLLNSLDSIRRSCFFSPQKLYHLIQMIRHSVTLITAVLEQTACLTEDIEQLLRDKLAELKYQILLEVIRDVDQIEIELMLRPGLLSAPLKDKLGEVYASIVDYVGTMVDFTVEDEPLQMLDERRFSELRADGLSQSIAELSESILKIKRAQAFADKFFAILEKRQYANKRLSTLPQRTKEILLGHYKMLAPYVAQLDVERNHAIISSLRTKNVSIFRRSMDYIFGVEGCSDSVESLLRFKSRLTLQLEKETQSHDFRRQLTMDQIDAMPACLPEQLAIDDDGASNLFLADEWPDFDESELQNSDHARAAYLVKKTQYTETIAKFRQYLKNFSNLFNQPMRDALSFAKAQGLPFPEAEVVVLGAPQSIQVLTLKHFHNALYYLEQFFVHLEILREDDDKILYLGKSALGAYYLGMFISTVSDILDDLYLGTLTGELIEQLKTTYQTASHLFHPYLAGQFIPEGVEPPIRHSSAYYALNALVIMPEHIQALTQGQNLPEQRVEALQQEVDEVAARIQQLMNQSNSYFRLFLATPSIYQLFQELKNRLKTLTDVSYHAVFDHLQEMREGILTRLLVTADEWEDRLSLRPGLISGDLKEILDEFYDGLLIPLGLPSQRHLALATNMTPLEQRREAAALRAESARTQSNAILEILTGQLNPVLEAMQTYKSYLGNESRDETAKAQLESILLERCTRALPILEQETNRFNLIRDVSPASVIRVDDSMLREMSIYRIEALTEGLVYDFEGVNARHQFAIQGAEEKMAYLDALVASQLQKNERFIAEYMSEAFKEKTVTLCRNSFGFLYFQTEYQKKLAEHLEFGREALLNRAQRAEDIKAEISVLLAEELAVFERVYQEDYRRLERIQIQIAEFKLYLAQAQQTVCKKKFCYESEKTLKAKYEKIEALETILKDDTQLPSERLGRIVGEVQKPMFKSTLLDYHRYEAGTLNWLWQWITSLFKLLFTGFEYQKNYRRLNQAVMEESRPPMDAVPDRRYAGSHLHFFQEEPPQPPNDSEEGLNVVFVPELQAAVGT